jgi:hypothetical protein
MAYNPQPESKYILDRAWAWIQSVPYQTTARWAFYRLLQDGTYQEKKGYKHLLGLMSKARKEFYGEWRPWTLADDTRAPVLMQRKGYYGLHLRGDGFKDKESWLKTIGEEINCPLDRWSSQSIYGEAWYEAAAMQGQFLYYANENLPLLAFHGDISIPEKWRTAERLAQRYKELGKPIHIYYFGDYDPKGLTIPLSAWRDIGTWAGALLIRQGVKPERLNEILNYRRIGINLEQIKELGIPENPERPGTYQWEALDDKQAEYLISKANELLDEVAFEKVKIQEWENAEEFKGRL